MEQFKKAQIIMLPTNKSKLIKVINPDMRISLHKNLVDKESKTVFQAQHLYIISDDEIKEGDWCLEGSEVFQVEEFNLITGICRDSKGNPFITDACEKIIATTDNSLKRVVGIGTFAPLPQPSQQFIEQYIEAYNKGEVITDVLIEYKNNYDLHYYTPAGGIECCKKIDNWKLLINPDNTINIKPIKDSWNREEVETLLMLAFNSKRSSITRQEEWIKENL